MIQRLFSMVIAGALCVGLVACSEKPQTASAGKADAKAFQGPASAYTAAGWKPGDAASWEQQMRTRAQSQDENSREGP